MQRLEVSGAVRLIYRSLGVKRLTTKNELNSVVVVVVQTTDHSAPNSQY